jgi:hypothetical protein
MGQIHAIAIDCINDKISSGEDFTYVSICDEIVFKGGILRVSIGVTIGMYLKNLVRLKILSFSNDIFQTHREYKKS